MNKTALKIAFFFITYCYSAYAQFYTVLPKEKVVENEIEDIVNISQNNESQEAKPIGGTFEINTPAEINATLSGLTRRQFLSLPIDTLNITSPFGWRNDPITGKRKFHKGIDISADYHSIYSIMPGRIIKAGKNRNLGNFVQIDHGDFISTYGHMYQILVSAKQTVEAGELIGISGSSGRSTGEHLHFQLTYKNNVIDPLPILNYIQNVAEDAKREIARILETEFKPNIKH
jgi:murein DD-endopeptidase MepM/ murein hydrolase activator NlpD